MSDYLIDIEFDDGTRVTDVQIADSHINEVGKYTFTNHGSERDVTITIKNRTYLESIYSSTH
jgi:hypothetical protein